MLYCGLAGGYNLVKEALLMKYRWFNKLSFWLGGFLIISVLVSIFVGGCYNNDSLNGDVEPPSPVTMPSSEFAPYRLQAVSITPSINHSAIAQDLSNVHVPMVLSETQRDRLAVNGIVASPGLQENIPVFITSDSLIHVYHLMFSKVLRTAETEYFYPLLQGLNRALITTLDAQYQQLRGGPWEEDALRAVAFVAVSGKLADSQFPVPTYTSELVKAELALINDANGILPSKLFPGLEYGEDYTQYIPRGHYTKSEALSAYFKSMMYYGRMTFRLNPNNQEVGRSETRSALLLVYALRHTEVGDRPALEVWADLYNPTAFLVGRSDDLTVFDYLPLVDTIYGSNPTLQVLADDSRLDSFINSAEKLPPPRILGMVIFEDDDEVSATRGLRFMGQRFVPDAYIFRQLIYDNVSDSDNRRGLPRGLDLFAAMGSKRAYDLLDSLGDTKHQNYPEQMAKMHSWIESLTESEWTETVYNAWLYSFYPLIEEPGDGYPQFMRSKAWLDKQLHTCLGSWAELKHDTILYAKQAYAEMGDGWSPTPPDPLPAKGYVEPIPQFFARLAALAEMTREGMAARNLLNEEDAESLRLIEELALDLKNMAEKQLQGIPLTESEHERIRYYGGKLEHLVMASADGGGKDEYAINYMDEDPQVALIADVATDPDPQGMGGFFEPVVLQVGVGRINEIHVVVPLVEDDGTLSLQVAKGGIFSYYEFPWPAKDRLTDEKWQGMLDAGSAPQPPEWINSFFTVEGEFHSLQQDVYGFQKAWVDAVFYLNDRYIWSDYYQSARGVALEQIRNEINTLKANKQFEGRQLISTDYRSFDHQSESLVVVTVRETWQDVLYIYEGPEHPANTYDEDDMIEVGQRGPYTMDMTYTLELDDDFGWLVVRILSADQRPAW